MADPEYTPLTEEEVGEPPMLDIPAAEEEAPKKRRKRKLIRPSDIETTTQKVLQVVDNARDERATWMDKRTIRYAKLRGWLDEGGVEEGRSDQHLPIMMANCLRMEAGLFNAVFGTRPIITGKPLSVRDREAAEKNDSLLDYQMFVENDGERFLEAFITGFVQDGTSISFQPRVVETRTIYDSRVMPRPLVPLPQAITDGALNDLVADSHVQFTTLEQQDEDGYEWLGEYADTEGKPALVPIEIYDIDDASLEVCFHWTAKIFDGPVPLHCRLEDIVVPFRSENCQPVTSQNPHGAPWVAKLSKVSLDYIKRMQKNGTYDYLTLEDIEELEPEGHDRGYEDPSHSEDAILKEKDKDAGIEPTPGSGRPDQEVWFTLVEWYGGHDCRDEGLEDEVILSVLMEPEKLCRAKYLTEQYPGLPPHRPFAESRPIPVPGQFYGLSIPEIQEGLHNFLHELINDNVDNGRLANTPFGFYRASSGFKPETIRLRAGDMYPLDSPQQDVFFPTLPHSDQTWSFNMFGLGMQMLDKVTQIGPLQMGQVPQGKASALRNVGTTAALLQQGATLSEQILRRLFFGLKDVWAQFHMINTRFLPPKKRYLITGKPLDSPDAYGMIDDRRDIDIPLTFDFQATITNSNKGLINQALMSMAAALVNPLMIQLGIVRPENVYNLAVDLIKSSQLDPARYTSQPMGMDSSPKITAEEALIDLTMQKMPESTNFVEGTQTALTKLMQFAQSPNAIYVDPAMFQAYVQAVQIKLQQEMAMMQMAQMAGQFQQAVGGGEGGDKGGRPAEPQEAPGMQMEAPSQDEIAGANQGA